MEQKHLYSCLKVSESILNYKKMDEEFMKKLFTKFLITALLVSVTNISIYAEDKKLSDMGIIARITANIFSNKQFRKKPLDDKLSEKLFEEYLNMLDPGKLYLTREDIAELKEYEKELDNQLLAGDVEFAFEVYELLINRIKEYRKFANSEIDKGFDFTKDEEFVFNREDAEWPKKSEQKELWRKKIKNDLLAMKLVEMAAEKEKAENKDKDKDKDEEEKEKVANLWKKTPEERIKKRIATLLNNLEKKRDIDKLEFYLASLAKIYDPHSTYMAPSRAENFDISMKNSLVGIGAVLTTDDGYTKIVRIIKGGPADKDGELEPEDRIFAVAQGDEEPVDIVDMPLDEVVQLIRGEKDTIVNLHVMKGKKGMHGLPEIITIKRDKVALQDQDAHQNIRELKIDGEDKKIGIIELPSFYIDFKGAYEHKPDYKSSTRDVKKILKNFKKEHVDGVIIDLRKNGGGSLREAIQLTGLFIDKGPIVQVKGADQRAPQVENDYDNKTYYNGPLIVLISKLSASAAEIFAAAIQDYGRGIIIGDKHSHGKGTVQTILDLNDILKHWGLKSDPGNLKVTVAKFYRINGESTQQKGVVPDIIFPNLTDSMEIGEKYLDYSLPWDKINPANYKITCDLEMMKQKLNAASKARRDKDPDFKESDKMIQLYEKMKNRKKVSLNQKKRWKQYIEDKKIIDQQTAILETENSDDENKKEKDIFMKEAVNIMCDWLKESDSETAKVSK